MRLVALLNLVLAFSACGIPVEPLFVPLSFDDAAAGCTVYSAETLEDDAGLARLEGIEGCVAIVGPLTIGTPGTGALVLDRIRAVGGDLQISRTGARAIELPELLHIGGALEVLLDASELEELRLPRLRNLGSVLVGAPRLTSLTIPFVARTGDIFVSACEALEDVSMLELREAGAITITRNPALTRVNMPLLDASIRLSVSDNAALDECRVLALANQSGAACNCACAEGQ